MVNFEKIHIEGFNSISKLSLPLGTKGLTFIKGINGVGKSTLFNALFWCLYGKHPKGLTATQLPTWKQYRVKGYRGTRVALNFSIGNTAYMVARHYKFKGTTKGVEPDNDLMVFEAAGGNIEFKDLVTEQHKKDVQKYLETEVLNMDAEAFKNALFFSQTAKRFIEESNSDKRSLFENIADLGWVDTARDLAKTDLLNTATAQDKLTFEHNNITNEVAILKEQVEKFAKIVSDFLVNKSNRISDLDTEIKGIKNSKEVMPPFNREEAKARLNITVIRYETKLASLEAGKVKLDTELRQLVSMQQNAKNNTVTLSESDYNNLLDREKKERSKYTEIQEKEASLTSSFISYEREISRITNSLNRAKTDLEGLERVCPVCTAPISPDKIKDAEKALKQQIIDNTEQVKVLTEKKESIRNDIEAVQKEKLLYIDALDVIGKEITAARELQDKHRMFTRQVKDLESKISFAKNRLLSNATDINTIKIDIEAAKEEVNIKLFEAETEYNKAVEAEEYRTKERIAHLERRKKAVADELPPETNAAETKQRISDLESRKKEIEVKLKDTVEKEKALNFWVKTGFSAKGLKSFVFQNLLKKINLSLAEYAARLGVKVKFTVDLNKISKPINTEVELDGFTVDYRELSGGQQQRVNIILMFAMFDLIGAGKSNLLILDEPFKFLDAESIEMCFELMGLKIQKGISIYCITHKVEVDAVNANYINLERRNGITEIV